LIVSIVTGVEVPGTIAQLTPFTRIANASL
jgi:hypothetical protein